MSNSHEEARKQEYESRKQEKLERNRIEDEKGRSLMVQKAKEEAEKNKTEQEI